jgi:sugar/nucleoside kinase (ribokinase family)
MIEILSIGEILVEIMREKVGIGLDKIHTFKGPYVSGAPAIFIDTVAKLGHGAVIVGGVGDDEFGRFCFNKLKDDGVDTSGIRVSKLPTGVAFVAYFEDDSRKFIFHIRDSAASYVGNLPEEKIKTAKIFHVMGCSLMIKKELAEKIIRYATLVKESGGKVSFDPNIRIELMNKGYIREAVETISNISDIVLPGFEELLLISNTDNKITAIEKVLDKAEILVLKKGKNGCEIYSKGLDKPLIVPPFKVKKVDPTGAGDSFDAGFLCAYIEGRSLYDCGVIANACGALNTTKFGPMEGVFKRNVVDKFIESKKV